MARPKRINIPVVRFTSKRACGTNGLPIKALRGVGKGRVGRTAAQKKADRKYETGKESKRAKDVAARRAVFRFVGKSYGLTFSQAEGIPDKETVHAHLQVLLGVHNSVVAHELHVDGSQHFHAGGHVDNRIDITDSRHFDIVDPDGRVHHPNIIHGGPAWNNYCKKGGDFISTFPVRVDHMAIALTLNSVDQAMQYLMRNDPASYVRFGHVIESNLARHYRKIVAVRVPMWYGPYPELREPPDWDPMTHALHLYGPPNSGKTVCAQHLLRARFGACEYIKGHVEALKGLSFTKPFVFDEIMLLTQPAATSREITDVVSGGTVHARYHPITIPPGLPRIFISNTRWVFKNPDDSVYGRRLIQWEHLPVCALTESSRYVPPVAKAAPALPPQLSFAEEEEFCQYVDPIFAPMIERWQMDHQYWRDTGCFPVTPPVDAPATPVAPITSMPETPLAIQMFGYPDGVFSPGWSPLLPFASVTPDTDPLRPFNPSDEESTLEL